MEGSEPVKYIFKVSVLMTQSEWLFSNFLRTVFMGFVVSDAYSKSLHGKAPRGCKNDWLCDQTMVAPNAQKVHKIGIRFRDWMELHTCRHCWFKASFLTAGVLRIYFAIYDIYGW